MRNTVRKILVLVAVVSVGVSLESMAQARAGVGAAGAAAPLRIRDLLGVGPRGLVRTPEYTSSVSRGRATARTWGEIVVQFDTEPEWIDELQFQYYVLLHDRRAKTYTFLKVNVTHTDVARGRGHLSAAYVRPAGLERYGEVVAAAVEAVIKGETVGVASEGRLPSGEGKLPPEWWKTTKLVPKDGYLLNRTQTPFVFANYDDYEVAK